MRIPFLNRRRDAIPILRLSGPIGMATPLRPGLSLATLAAPLEKLFTASKHPAVAISINSPGGSPVQSNLIHGRIRALAREHNKHVHIFCEDVVASGGYVIAAAGDEIYADPSSIIGSIGVITQSFGLDKAIERLGIERRVYTAGTNKGSLDPFLPEKPDDIARLKAMQADVHEVFKSIVRTSRGPKLKDDPDLFTGAFWAAGKAQDLGLIDGIGDPRTRLRQLYGDKIELKLIPLAKTGLLQRLTRSGTGEASHTSATINGWLAGASLAEDTLSTLEARALWARFGL